MERGAAALRSLEAAAPAAARTAAGAWLRKGLLRPGHDSYPTADNAADRRPGVGIFCQYRVGESLPDVEATRCRLRILWNRLVLVGRHGKSGLGYLQKVPQQSEE